MGIVAEDASEGAVPTLAVSPHDDLFLLYHTEDSKLRIWRSDDYGYTWTDHATYEDLQLRYPRLVFTPEGAYLVAWAVTGESLRVFHVVNFNFADPDIQGVHTVEGVPEQLAALEYDRHGVLHLYHFVEAGSVTHLWAQDPGHLDNDAVPVVQSGEWTEETFSLLAQDYGAVEPPVGTDAVSVAVGLERALVAHQEFADFGGSSFLFRTDEVFTLPGLPAIQHPVNAPEGVTFDNPQVFGTLVNRHEHFVICAFDDEGTLLTFVSTDQGATWAAPA